MDLLIAITGIGFLLGFFFLFFWLSRPTAESALLAEVTEQDRTLPSGTARPTWWTGINADRFAKPFGWFRSLFGGEPNPELVRRLSLAGYRKRSHVDLFLGVRLLLPVVLGLAVAFWVKGNVFFWFILAIVAAFFLPDVWVNQAIKKRRERIRLSLPDALDLLVICMEAGLGLDQAIVHVGKELSVSHPELSEEFLQINLEQRAGNPRIGAWRNMADRVDVENVRSFVNMLIQTERFGTPISRSLGAFSDALRTQRRQQAEEMAAKTTIKLVLPLVFFIFPSIFIVTVAPAVITLMKSFSMIK
ncbi:MAG TPA: type II secretion system F family protein [Terriglobia bacterium]|jgi:tight adherence protein C|nr:type II secretion system F family protein [Terriglobia bacterium]